MAEENMKQNSSVKAPNSELEASTTRPKNMSMEYAEVSLKEPTREALPSVNFPEFVFSFVSTALSAVIYELIYVLFLLLVFAVRLLTFSLTATSNWLLKTMEKLNGEGKGKGRESDVDRGETNNLLETSLSGMDEETTQSNSVINETNNPNQRENNKEDHRSETANSVDCGKIVESFNNSGGGKQDCSNLKVKSTTSKYSCNNRGLGSQVLKQANILASEIVGSLNNESSNLQTLDSANIGNTYNGSVPIIGSFNNGENGTQNFDGFEYTTNTKSPD
ncbi:hypothetical protein ACSQ67_004059 [Phaseolus vulgaris]